MDKPLRILHLEDDLNDAELVQAALAGEGVECELVRVDTRAEFEEALERGGFDLIVSDYALPTFDGGTAQKIVQERHPDIPFIFVSGTFGEEAAIERLKAGATDYVLKHRLEKLPSVVRRALREAQERVERTRAEDEIRKLNAELERRVAERTIALAESETRLQGILDHSPTAIYLKDREGRYLLANSQFAMLAGKSTKELIGKTDHELFPPRLADMYRANDIKVSARGTALEFEEVMLRDDGPHLFISSKFPLYDGAGAPYALCGISTDITERKNAEDAAKMAKMEAERANRAKSDFLSRMSHDLRTPLNAILGFTQLLEMDDLSGEQRESVGHILGAGRHLLDLLNEVLDIARIESGRLSLSPESVAVSGIIGDALDIVRPLAAPRRVDLNGDQARTCAHYVLADRSRLNQILLNLLSNAIKYNHEGGLVSVSCEEVPGERLRIKVVDTGPGIHPEMLRLLFTPFERLDADQSGIEGTGLGLALSRGLAEAMGGTVDVESEVDRGSTFWVELALASPVHEEVTRDGTSVPLASDETPDRSGTVLYIEDNLSNVRLLERLIKRRCPGVELLSATLGQQGLVMAREHRPDLVFLDLNLPDTSGDEVLRQLQKDHETRQIPVVVLSADATPSQIRRLQAAGAAAYLTKPLDIGQVLKLLDERLSTGKDDRRSVTTTLLEKP